MRRQERESLVLSDMLAAAVASWCSWIAPVIDEVTQAGSGFSADLARVMEGVRPFLEGLPDRMQCQFANFTKCGWYPDVDMDFRMLEALSDSLESSTPTGNALCAEHFRRELPRIEAELTRTWPERAAALKEGFTAHEQRMFFASIPVFLAQAEGVGRKGLRIRLFATNARRRLLQLSSGLEDCVFEAMVLPLRPDTPLYLRESERPVGYTFLNRHAVMHGDPPLDYGSEENSLRAVSYLHYVATMTRLVGQSPE